MMVYRIGDSLKGRSEKKAFAELNRSKTVKGCLMNLRLAIPEELGMITFAKPTRNLDYQSYASTTDT